jgi:hypothetical protein
MPSSLQHLATKARDRVAIRRIDPVGRAAYGSLCVAAMASIAVPLLIGAGVAVAAVELARGESTDALVYGLGAIAAAALAGGLFLAIFYAAYPLASDWITEWAGYAFGIVIGGAWLAVMAILLFLAPIPVFLAIALPLLGAFFTGFAVAGKLAGMRAPSARPRQKAHTLRRR